MTASNRGRPRIGGSRLLSFSVMLYPEDVERLDRRRGDVSRSAWIRRAIARDAGCPRCGQTTEGPEVCADCMHADFLAEERPGSAGGGAGGEEDTTTPTKPGRQN